MDRRSDNVLGLSSQGFHRIHYSEWGEPSNDRVLICAHGLTRNGRDFDDLAAVMADRYHVMCPDVVGRGQSDWLTDKSGYSYPQYLADMTVLIARSGAARVDWVGTSMGGLIGMLLAAQPRSPIRRLVMNDIGPFIPKAALERIANYVGQTPMFGSFTEAEQYIRTVSAPFGPLSDAQWRHLTEHNIRQRDDGYYILGYDPGIAEVFHSSAIADVDLWPFWDRVNCPVLLLRGEESDLLRRDDAQAMAQRGPGARLIEFARVGHAPMLMNDEQIIPVRNWLLAE